MSENVLDQEKLDNILSGLPFTLNDQQLSFIVKFITMGGNWCLNSEGGVGKSCIMLILKKYYGDEIVFFSSSGVSSLNMPEGISSGTTHSGLSLSIKMATEYDHRKISSKCSALFASSDLIKIIVIDEAFSHNADNLDLIHRRIQRFNKRTGKRGKRNIRLLLAGDNLQQLPIVSRADKRLMTDKYEHYLMFMSEVWDRFDFHYAVLSKVMRQDNKTFKACLSVIRNYEYERFDKCLRWLNTRYDPNYTPDKLVLAATNKTVKKINDRFLKQNPNPKTIFYPEKTGVFNEKDLLIGETFTACEGLKVMFVVNESPEHGSRFVNGTCGTILKVMKDSIIVLTDSGEEILVEPYVWENRERYVVKDVVQPDGSIKDELKERILGTYRAFCLTQSNSFSIAKCQGLTISSDFVIDLESTWLYTTPDLDDFGSNYVYLATSRASSVDLITFATKVEKAHIKPCHNGLTFWEFCKEANCI